MIYISCIVDLVCVFLCTFVLKQIFGFTGAQPILTAQSSMTVVTLATVVYDPINAPAADPKNQLELTLVRDTACHTSTRFCVATRFCVTSQAFPTGCHSCEFFYSALMSSYVQLNSPVKLWVLRWIRRSRQQWIWRCKENSSTRPSIPSYIQTFAAPMRGFWTLGGQWPCFCRFSLHVLLVGFIRFLLDWIWLNWIDWVFWDMREKTRSESVRIVTVRDDFCQN